MFCVFRKTDDPIDKYAAVNVYDVQYKNGYPYFLLYEDGQWITTSAKYFRPMYCEDK